MWALRPASNSIRNRFLCLGFFPLCHMRSEIAVSCSDRGKVIFRPSGAVFDIFLPLSKLSHSEYTIPRCSMWKNTFCSQSGTRSCEEDFDDGFFELSAKSDDAETGNTENVKDLISVVEHSEDDQDSINLNKPSRGKKTFSNPVSNSELFEIVSSTRPHLLDAVLNKWIKDGKYCRSEDMPSIIKALHKLGLYAKALKFSEWLEKKKKLELSDESDYACRVDLIAILNGISSAEKYIESIPISFRGEKVYQTLMANCVAQNKRPKAEEIFHKMEALKLPISHPSYEQLLTLYSKTNDRKRMNDVLCLMNKNNLKPKLDTYRILIHLECRTNDIAGIENILEKMKAHDIKPDIMLRSTLVKVYTHNGHKEKAEGILKELEDEGTIDRPFFPYLLPLYAALGNTGAVRKLCHLCEPNPTLDERTAAIDAWGKLHNIEMAEAAFSKAANNATKLSLNLYHSLLRVYVEHKEVVKGKELVKQMKSRDCLTSFSWESLVKLFLDSGDYKKAEMALLKASEMYVRGAEPWYRPYVDMMKHYAEKGDVHNCERFFKMSKQAGIRVRIIHFRVLVRAYTIAKMPGFGLMERMKAEGIEPKLDLLKQLDELDSFLKTSELDLLG